MTTTTTITDLRDPWECHLPATIEVRQYGPGDGSVFAECFGPGKLANGPVVAIGCNANRIKHWLATERGSYLLVDVATGNVID